MLFGCGVLLGFFQSPLCFQDESCTMLGSGVCDSGLKTLGCLVKGGRVTRERVEPVSAHSQPCLGLSGFMPW